MVLDDEPFMLKMMGRILSGLGYADVVFHERAAEALLAYDMPDCVPNVILLSGMEELLLRAAEKLARAHNISVVGVLSKPALPVELAALLAKCTATVIRQPQVVHKTYEADEVRAAIENGELVNYYQPKVFVDSGELAGVETLVRWQHPTDGLVLPEHFIPVAEVNGLITDLTHVVLGNALRQARLWRDAGMPLRVAINVSMDDLADVGFTDSVLASLEAAGVEPELLELEVTETRLMGTMTSVLDVLARLRLNRIRLSIDDFGTGNSSLVQLRDLPFDELKVDRSFTHNARHDARLKAIFEASLDLANYLDMELVAEGVEDADDWAFMQATGCHIAQGYYIAHPMPGERLDDWFGEWLARVAGLIR